MTVCMILAVVSCIHAYCCFSHGLFVASIINDRMAVVSFCATLFLGFLLKKERGGGGGGGGGTVDF